MPLDRLGLGGTFEIQRRFGEGYGLHASYTISETRTNVDSLANLSDLPEGQDIDIERAPSRQDVGHRFTLAMLSEIPSTVRGVGGVKVSGLVTLESGTIARIKGLLST